MTEDDMRAVKIAVAAVLEAFDAKERHADELLTIRQVAAEEGVDEKTIRNKIRRERLPAQRDPVRGVTIRRWDLERWRKARTRYLEQAR